MREEYSGWFVEVPRSLKKEFKRLYPGRSVQRRITLAAIEWAIKSHPSMQGDSDVSTKMQADHKIGEALQIPSGEERTLLDAQQDGSGTARTQDVEHSKPAVLPTPVERIAERKRQGLA
jgi:hypothetical protein